MDININIKKLNKKDIPEIVVIHRQCVLKLNSQKYSPEKISEWLSQITTENVLDQINNSSWVTAFVDKKIVGFAQYSLENKTIFQLNIDPDFTNIGIGKKIYHYVEKDFIKNKICKISLYSTINAVGFYQKMGFEKIKNVKIRLDKEFIDEVEMIKKI